jgi:2,3-bisphosphoglycerate-dependent phosphoglycerate mutase
MTEVRVLDLVKHPRQGETGMYLIRHGQTEANVLHQLVGSTDVPLDPIGLVQAERVAERMAPISLDAILSSPLQRALTTARVIGDRVGLTPRPVDGLVELDFGQLEGRTLTHMIEQHPELAIRLANFDDLDVEWPGGETRRGFHARVSAAFLAILEEYSQHTVAVVAHGGVIGSFLAYLEGGQANDFVRYAVFNCSVTHIVVTRDQTLVHCWNDVSHLDDVDTADYSFVADGAEETNTMSKERA